MGARVEWQAQTRTVSITSSDSAPPVPGQPPVTETEPLKVVLLGGLASGNFTESASQGMQLIKSRFGAA
ncbi:MAG: hypothetical protein SCK57_14420, partial [Bacillota bacterium]|nr:hypothetical protein [Bacillota bacterium]